jgi:uncharacterized RDD family membrane protein YckC
VKTLPGFVSRLLAFGTDIFAMAAICLLATQAIRLTGEFFQINSFAIGRKLVDLAVRVSIVSVIAVYLPASWALTGRSIGKALMGLRIVRTDGTEFGIVRSAVRFAGYWLSAIPFGLGFFASLVDQRRRTFHDRIAGTLVVYDERP